MWVATKKTDAIDKDDLVDLHDAIYKLAKRLIDSCTFQTSFKIKTEKTLLKLKVI